MRWPEVPLKRVAELVAGGTPSTSDDQMWSDDGIPWISISDMSGSDQVLDTKRRVSRSGQTSARLEVRPPGTVLFAMYASVGEVSVTGVASCWNQALLGILPDAMKLNKRFLFYVLKDVKRRLPALYRSNTQDNLNAEQVGELKIPLPSVEVQKRVADYLDRETAEIDAFIAEQRALLERLGERRASVVDHVLDAHTSTRGPLKYRGTLNAGITLGGRYDGEVQSYPYIRVANVQAGSLDLSSIASVELPPNVAASSRLESGDVLMTEGGDRDKLGRGALWSGEIEGALHQNHVFAFRCGRDLRPEFLVYVLGSSSARKYFEATASQSTNLASTNSTLVKRFKIPDVPISVQRDIVAELDSATTSIDMSIADAQKLIDLSMERRSALISAAVTGQIDVTNP